ncbi:MAG: hypothetical protein JNJ90_01035 [Saprospiraceae bacterium]|jgi:hypothetical protein|nr:hypothetical protein [Saprospiraceae bacterium]
MQEILELIRVLEQHNIRFTQADSEADDNLLRLLNEFRNGQYAPDTAVGSTPGASADYSDLETAQRLLQERLGQAVKNFVTELEQFTDVQQAHLECQKLWLNVRMLSGQNAAILAIDLAGHILNIAAKFDFTLLAMDVAMYLRMQCCMQYFDSETCAQAEAKYQFFRQTLDAEFRAEKMYSDMTARWWGGHASEESLQQSAKANLKELEILMATFSSSKLHLYGNLIQVQQYLFAQELPAAAAHCEKSIRYFLGKPYQARDPLQVFYYHLLLCSIHLCDAERGKKAAYLCLGLVGEHVSNQFKIRELLVLLFLHSRNYQEAANLFCSVTADSRFAFLPGALRANWSIFGAYLALAGIVSPDEIAIRFERKEATTHPGTLLIAEYIRLLQEKRLEAARNRVPELEHFLFRRNAAPTASRTSVFIQMLLLVSEADFQPDGVSRLVAGHLEHLQTLPLDLATPTLELEVLPYEDLWQIVLQTLEAGANRQ